MATPTVTTKNFQTIWDCESVTGAVGNKPVLEPEIKKQSSNSVGFTTSTVGTNNYCGFDGTIPNSGDLTGEHCRFWYASIVFPNINTKVLGGLRFYLSDGTNESYWNIAGKDTYSGGWINICVYASSTPDSNNGTNCNIAAVTEMGVVHDFLSSPKNLTNVWVDYLRLGDGLIATGGTSGDEIDMAGIYADDETNGYGIVEWYEGKPILSGSLDIGDSTGTATTYFKYQSGGITFSNKNVSSTLYTLSVVGNSTGDTHADFGGTFLSTNAVSWIFDLNDTNIDSANLDGCTLQGAIDFYGSASVSCDGTVFDACGMLEPGATDLDNFTVKNGIETDALQWPSSPAIASGQFINNDRAIRHDVAESVTYDALLFSDNTYNIHNASTGLVAISTINGSNPGDPAVTAINTNGGTTTVSSAAPMEVTVIDDDTGLPIEYAHILILKESDKSTIVSAATTSDGKVSGTYTESTPEPYVGWVRQWDLAGDDYTQKNISGSITSAGLQITVRLEPI